MREGYDPEAAEQLAQALPPFLQRLLPLPPPEEWLAPVPPCGARHGAYEIETEIGRGGMGVVYRARQRSLNRTVALKLLLTGLHAGAEVRRRFEAEARALAALRHPNIVQIHEAGEWPADGAGPPLPFLCLEYVEGDSLADRLDGTPWPARPAAELVETLARAIQHAHERGVVHRDLKPGNILFGDLSTNHTNRHEGKKELEKGRAAAPSPSLIRVDSCDSWIHATPKITDFGLARFLDGADDLTRSGALLGTPSYMAPEQAEGGRPVGPAADVYALGILLYELLTGRPPFRGATPLETLEQLRTREPVTPRQLQPSAPRDLETICLKCLEKEPAKRYASAQELAGDLRRWLDGQPIGARPVGSIERAWRWCRRKPAVASLIAATTLVVLGAFFICLLFWRQAAAERRQALEHLRDTQQARQAAEESEQATQQILAEFVQLGAYRLPPVPIQQNTLGVEVLEKAEVHYQNLLGKRGTDPGLRHALAVVHLNLGTSLYHRGRLDEAQPRLENARLLWEDLLTKEVGNPGYLDGLGNVYHHLGELYARRRRLPEALQAQQRAQSLLEELIALQPNPARRLLLVWSDLALSRVLIAAGRTDDGRQQLERTHLHLERLAGNGETEAACQPFQATVYDQLSESYQKLGETAKARQAKHRAEQLRKSLEELHMDDLAFATELLKGVSLLAQLHNQAGQPDVALDIFHRLAGVILPYTNNLPRTPEDRYRQAELATKVAMDLQVRAPPADALPLAEQANRIIRHLVQEAPERLEYGAGLSESWYLLGRIHWKLGQAEETLEAFRQAVSAQRRVVEQAPAAEHRERLGERYLRLARKLCELGRIDEAEACIRERQQLWPGDAERLREVVRTLRRWAAEVGDGQKPLTSAEERERQRYLEFSDRLERKAAEPPARRR